jgi:hypothetical protein
MAGTLIGQKRPLRCHRQSFLEQIPAADWCGIMVEAEILAARS